MDVVFKNSDQRILWISVVPHSLSVLAESQRLSIGHCIRCDDSHSENEKQRVLSMSTASHDGPRLTIGDGDDEPRFKKSSTNESWLIPGHERYGGAMTGSIELEAVAEGIGAPDPATGLILNTGYNQADAGGVPEGNRFNVECLSIF